MKTRTKLLTAVLSTVTALSCALTAAAAGGPTIALKGNETTPAAAEAGSVTLTLKATEFSSVAGADLEITLNEGITLTGITVTNAGDTTWAPALNENYAVKNNKLKIVDIFNMGTENNPSLDLSIKLDFNNANIGRYEFTNNIRLVDEDEQDITTSSVAFGKLVIGKKTATAQTAVTAPSGAFVPYGSVVFGDSTYAEKDETGAFKGVSESKTANVTSFILPVENAVTTFGASYDDDFEGSNTVQFGSYIHSIAAEANSFGTVLIYSKDLTGAGVKDYKKGSYEGAVEYFGSADELFKDIITKFGTKNKIDGKFHPYAYGGNGNTNDSVIYACVVKQNNYMWKHYKEDKTLDRLQYAVRCKTSTPDRDFTAVGYIKNKDETYSFSTEIKTESYNSLSKDQLSKDQ